MLIEAAVMQTKPLDRRFYAGFFLGLLTGVVAALHAAGVIFANAVVPTPFENLVSYATWVFGWIGVIVSVADASSGSRLIGERIDGYVVGFGTFIATYGLLVRIPLGAL